MKRRKKRTRKVRSYKRRIKGRKRRVRSHRRAVVSQSAIVKEVSDKTNIKRSEVKKTYDELFRVTGKHLKMGHGVRLNGLGSLNVKTKPARKARSGRNPFTGEKIMIKAKPASKVIKFRPSKEIKKIR